MVKEQLLAKLSTYKNKFCGYQGWDKIDLKGQRPTEKRLEIYNLKNILTMDSVVLDIGCNIGCLSMQIAENAKEVYGIDDASYLIEQANLIKDFLQIKNVHFDCVNMFNYHPNVKFDIILYLAADFASPLEFRKYAIHLRSILNEDGYIIFESHVMPEHKTQFDCFIEIFKEVGFKIKWNSQIQEDTRSTLREFVVLQKSRPEIFEYYPENFHEVDDNISQRGRILWFTGHREAGKTEMAKLVYSKCKNFIMLDGDEMRYAIAFDLGLSKKDRWNFQIRIARLAKILTLQKINVVIAAICAHPDIRSEVDKIIKCEWIYVKRDDPYPRKEVQTYIYPYFPPENACLTLDFSYGKLFFKEAFDILVKELKLERKMDI